MSASVVGGFTLLYQGSLGLCACLSRNRIAINATKKCLSRWRYLVRKIPLSRPLASARGRLPVSTFIVTALVASRNAALLFGKRAESKMAEPAAASDASIMEEADRLYHSNNSPELYAFMTKHKGSQNVDVLWRICRACRDVAQMAATNASRKKELTYEAMEYAKECLKLDEGNFASHKWFAICISDVGDYEGTKQKISNAYMIRDHFLKAIELNPNDATCYHLMGLWCFTFADMPWYQKKIAAAIFGTPPSSTYEEALGHFLKGEEVNPNFYSKNLLMLGKTYVRMKNKEQAKVFLNKTINYPGSKEEDKQAGAEAKQLISGI